MLQSVTYREKYLYSVVFKHLVDKDMDKMTEIWFILTLCWTTGKCGIQ